MPAIRTTEEINQIINMSQHALADLGLEFIQEEQQGIDTTDVNHRDKMYRIVLLTDFLEQILDVDATIFDYYLESANEKKFNDILDGLVQLSLGFSGPAISVIGINQLLYFFNNPSGGGGGGGGGGPANPGGTTFQNLHVDSPGELIDTFDANQSTFALYLYSATGTNPGEGSRTGMIMASWNGSNNPEFAEIKTPDVGGITTPITFSVGLASGQIQLNAATSTDGWVVKGVRILFQNISFINPVGPLPVGGTTGQFLAKASNADYDAIWQTLIWTMITDVSASLAEINRVAGVTSPIQGQLDAIVASLANYVLTTTLNSTLANYVLTSALNSTLANYVLTSALNSALTAYLQKAGGTMTGAIAMGNHKITGLTPGAAPGEAATYDQLPTNYVSGLLVSKIAITNWNMALDVTKSIPHGLSDFTKFAFAEIRIFRDDFSKVYDLVRVPYAITISTTPISVALESGRIKEVNSTDIVLEAGFFFQDGNFSGAGTRGKIYLFYEP